MTLISFYYSVFLLKYICVYMFIETPHNHNLIKRQINLKIVNLEERLESVIILISTLHFLLSLLAKTSMRLTLCVICFSSTSPEDCPFPASAFSTSSVSLATSFLVTLTMIFFFILLFHMNFKRMFFLIIA